MLKNLIETMLILSITLGVFQMVAKGQDKTKELEDIAIKLQPFHKKLSAPQYGEWLYHHREEGQTFRQYLESSPITLGQNRHTIYIQPLGNFTPTHRKIVNLTAEFMECYFGIPVKIQPDLTLDLIPAKAKRIHPTWGDSQILSTYVLYSILKPRLPKDACVYLALTSSDLWPGEGWNFVFGQASLRERVGVWSLYRNGNPEKSEMDFRLCLLRTLKTATHETGHMFSLHHCILYECNMCGSNHREESDRRPLWLCPECMPKICFATKSNPVEHYQKQAAFCKTNGLKEEREFYENSLAVLKKKD